MFQIQQLVLDSTAMMLFKIAAPALIASTILSVGTYYF